MRATMLQALHARRVRLRSRWEELLRQMPAPSPLGHPEVLVHLIDDTLAAVLGSLERPSRHVPTLAAAAALLHPACRCGRNPYLAYFLAGEQALLEELVRLLAMPPFADALARDAVMAELYTAVRRIARREIDAICGVCPHGRDGHACPRRVRREAAALAVGGPTLPFRAGGCDTPSGPLPPPDETPG